MAFLLPFFSFGADAYNSSGHLGGIWFASILSFSSIVTLVNLKLGLITLKWTGLSLAVLIASILIYFLSILFMCADWFAINYQPQTWNLANVLFFGKNPTGWLLYISLSLLVVLPDFLYEGAKLRFFPNPLSVQMYLERSANCNAGWSWMGRSFEPSEEAKRGIKIAPSKPPVRSSKDLTEISVEESKTTLVEKTGFTFLPRHEPRNPCPESVEGVESVDKGLAANFGGSSGEKT